MNSKLLAQAGQTLATAPCSAILDPYAAFFEWCNTNGFLDVGSGLVGAMSPKRFDAAIASYASRPNDQAQRLAANNLNV